VKCPGREKILQDGSVSSAAVISTKAPITKVPAKVGLSLVFIL
jgi:hypothetical protein